MLLDNGRRRGVEVVVSLDADRIVSAADLPERGAAGDPRRGVQLGRGRRARRSPATSRPSAGAGVDPADVHVEPWSIGTFEPGPGRVARAISWVRRDDTGDNPYSRPLYGLVAVVDMDDMRVLRVDDHAPGTPPPSGEWRRLSRRRRAPVPHRPAPDRDHAAARGRASSLTATTWPGSGGTCASASTPARASSCTTSATRDGGERRPICHRASIAELVIPYGDPNPTTHFKNVFDTGEYGLGPLTNSLRLGLRLRRRDRLPGRRHQPLERRRASRSKTRSASTRRTRTCSGSTPTTTPAASIAPARAGS